METVERLAKLETRMEIMAPKVDAMYDMMLEDRGRAKERKTLLGYLKSGKAVAAYVVAGAGYVASHWFH